VTGGTDGDDFEEDDSLMSQTLLCADCPDCHSEIIVNLETSHRPFSDSEKMLYRLVCTTCGHSYDVHFEDLQLRDKPEEEIARRNRVTTFARR
jgi:hypothetical protein